MIKNQNKPRISGVPCRCIAKSGGGLEKPHEQKGSVGLGSVCVFFLFQQQLNEVLLMTLILRNLVYFLVSNVCSLLLSINSTFGRFYAALRREDKCGRTVRHGEICLRKRRESVPV